MATAAGRFVVFGPQHRVVLLLFALGCVALVLLGVRCRSRAALQTRMLRSAGVVILLACAPFEVEDALIGVQHPRTGLPLQICDIAWLVAGIALLTRGSLLCSVLYYWGLTLCAQALLTPDLHEAFPQPQFFGFWVRHLVPVWAAVYLVATRIGPTWRGYRFTVGVTAAWAAVMMGINAAIGSNYGYLNGKPQVHSLLDLLGAWPWYVLVEVLLIVGVWALITWPWNRRH